LLWYEEDEEDENEDEDDDGEGEVSSKGETAYTAGAGYYVR